jgi:hypothetical protein
MRIARPQTPLSEAERVTLESLAHRLRTSPQVPRRARIVLACAGDVDNRTVARNLRLAPQTVSRWRVFLFHASNTSVVIRINGNLRNSFYDHLLFNCRVFALTG